MPPGNGTYNLSLCEVYINQSNSFISNVADDGGAIIWTKDKPIIDPKTNVFRNNSAFYGIDIASYPG